MFENSRSSWDAALRWHAAHPYHRMLTAAAPNSITTDAPAPPHGDPPPAAAAGDGPPLDAGTLTQRARRSARAAWVASQVHETTTTCMRCLNMQDLLTSRDCAQGRPRPSCPCPPVVPAPAHAPAPAGPSLELAAPQTPPPRQFNPYGYGWTQAYEDDDPPTAGLSRRARR